MSKFAMLLLFIKAFIHTLKTTFNEIHLEELEHRYASTISKNGFDRAYFQDLYTILRRQRVDVRLDGPLLDQIKGPLYLPSAGTAFAWLMEFNKYLNNYIDSPQLRGSDEVYIPQDLKAYFLNTNSSISNLDYLRQGDVICSILPYVEDLIMEMNITYSRIELIEDEISRDYYYSQIKPFARDINTFLTRTIEWVNTYDRTQ